MKIKVILSCLLLIIALGVYISRSDSVHVEDISVALNDQDVLEIQEDSSLSESQIIIVDVSGEVNKPGIVKIQAKSRVFQAIELAGGLKESADTKNLNLAAVISDGEKIYIAKIGEEQLLSGLNAKGQVDINSADSETLQTIKGVGPSTADKIILYRDSKGRFKKIEDILNVDGIGEKTFEQLKMQICIN